MNRFDPILAPKFESIRAQLKTEFVFANEVIDCLVDALQHQKNIILYGPGGHAKSSLAERALRLLLEENYDKEVYEVQASADSDPTPFLGYVNIPKWQSAGVYETIVTDTVFVKMQYLLLEEGLDLPGPILEGMKQPAMAGRICVDGVCIPSRLKSIIICTNHSPKDWMEEDPSRVASRSALLSRFTFTVNVKWPSYTASEWLVFFENRKIDNPALMASFMESCHTHGYPIAPREAEGFAYWYNSHKTLSRLAKFAKFEAHPEAFNSLFEVEKNIAFITAFKEVQTYVDKCELDKGTNLEELALNIKYTEDLIAKLPVVPATGDYSTVLATSLGRIKVVKEALIKKVAKV